MITDEEKTKAILDSIKQWEEDILQPLLNGKKASKYSFWKWEDDDDTDIPACSEHCPLCTLFSNSCGDCPLGKVDRCTSSYSTWRYFMEYKGAKSAQNMIDVLKSLL